MNTSSLDNPAFHTDVLAADLAQLRAILAAFFAGVPPDGWARPTEERPGGWTLGQTLAHVVAVAEMMDQGIAATLDGRPFSIPGLEARGDLKAYNQQQIADRAHIPPETLVAQLDTVLAQTAHRVAGLDAEALTRSVAVTAYNRPISVAEAVGQQLAHPGITHAAQLPNALGAPPLWAAYDADLQQRQLTRFFHVMSYAYWPERGGDLVATVQYAAEGPGGGAWYVIARPDGGEAGEGAVADAAFTLRARSPDVLCRLLTMQLNTIQAVMGGQLTVQGDRVLAARIPKLFIPT